MTRKITALAEASALDGSELVPIVQSGVTVRTTAGSIGPTDTLRGAWDMDAIPPNVVTTVDETHLEEAFFQDNVGIYVFELTYAEDTYKDLPVRPGADETLLVWLSDPRLPTTEADFLGHYVAGYETNPILTMKFDAGVTYWVGIVHDYWTPAGSQVDIGPIEYTLARPSRVGAVRNLLFPGTTVVGRSAEAEGGETEALGYGSHAEGSKTLAKGIGAHAEGIQTSATGHASHAQGSRTYAEGDYSHAQGRYAVARAYASSALGGASSYSIVGDAQQQELIRSSQNNITLSVDNIIPDNFYARIIARVMSRNSAGDEYKTWTYEALLSSWGSLQIIDPVLTVVNESAGATTWSLDPYFMIVGGARQFRFTPTNRPIGSRNVMHLRSLELG